MCAVDDVTCISERVFDKRQYGNKNYEKMIANLSGSVCEVQLNQCLQWLKCWEIQFQEYMSNNYPGKDSFQLKLNHKAKVLQMFNGCYLFQNIHDVAFEYDVCLYFYLGGVIGLQSFFGWVD